MSFMEIPPIGDRRGLIVNADDFGYSPGVNRGILQAHRCGIVTSASLMVRQPAATEATSAARDCPCLSVGLHLDLGEWAYRHGQWMEIYRVVALDDLRAVEQEIRRQLDHFFELTGLMPTHLDSHQHVHRDEPVRSVLIEVGRQLGIPVRHESPQIKYCGAFYGQTAAGEPLDGAISVDSLIDILGSLPRGISELGCHPGFADRLDTMYVLERSVEVATLCSPRVRAALVDMEIELLSFQEVTARADRRPGAAPNAAALPLEASA
jgi:predicted glycoside hydrolase/deacetylase ChbG (UPF0249 family)